MQDLVFYGRERPVIIRLHILVNGVPYSRLWVDHVERRFKFADTDENGFLDKEEVRLLPSAESMQAAIRAGVGSSINLTPLSMAEVDRDGDGRVTPAELQDCYRAQMDALRLQAAFAPSNATALTEALYRHLDRDKDGKLSKAELEASGQLVARLDNNDDETVDASEMLPQPAMVAPPGGDMNAVMPAQMPRTDLSVAPFFLVPREDAPNRLTRRLAFGRELLARYDRDKSGKLTRQEIGLESEVFGKLDTNKDETLDAVEVVRYLIGAPDLEATVKVGDRSGTSVDITPGSRANLVKSLRRTDGDALAVALRELHIEVRATGAALRQNPQQQEFLSTIFRALDPAKKGYIDLKKMTPEMLQQIQVIRGTLEMSDRDGNGRLTRQELEAQFTMMNEVPRCTTSLSGVAVGRGVFELLDVSKDGRLSMRELRTAGARLLEFDHNGDGVVEPEEFPQQFQLLVSPGFVPPPPRQANLAVAVQRGATGGPVWFRKMDRNGDGDVSPREFLGSPDDFKKLDLDGDGVISRDESEKIDAQLRARN